jgi:FlaA1/EpsC-like NDP-sugar epimerase
MPSVRIRDLIESALEELCQKNKFPASSIKINVIGKKHGEKLYEALMTESEINNMKELKDMCVLYAEKECGECTGPKDIRQFHSGQADPISKDEIKRMLRKIEWAK